jgi:hypothetical protein
LVLLKITVSVKLWAFTFQIVSRWICFRDGQLEHLRYFLFYKHNKAELGSIFPLANVEDKRRLGANQHLQLTGLMFFYPLHPTPPHAYP